MSPAQAIDGNADLACWRARAERAEAAAAQLRQENSELDARVAALSAEVGRLQEAVTTLSGLLFGTSSEKRAPAARAAAARTARAEGRMVRADGGSVLAGRGTAAAVMRTWRPRNASSTWNRRSGAARAAGPGTSSSAPRTAS